MVTAVVISAVELVFKGGALYGHGLYAGMFSKKLEIEDNVFDNWKKRPSLSHVLVTHGFKHGVKHGVDAIFKERES